MIGVLLVFLGLVEIVRADRALSRSSGPPAFFLQDTTDGLCLAGSKYKRCALDSLWYVVGKPGSYQIHHRPMDEEEQEDLCLDKAQCHLDESEVQLANCNHCGARKWNILGENQSGYVLTEDGNKFCLKRAGDTPTIVKCDKGYSTFNLQFATRDDIEAMSSDGARLITAASDNDKVLVQEFLSKGVSINARDWDNMTALIAASGKGHEEMVQFLVDKGAEVNLRDKDNITAVTEAAVAGNLNILTYLASKGAEMDVKAASGVSPLWLAAGEGRQEIVHYLLTTHKADPNAQRSDGITAIMAAAAGGHEGVVGELLGARAEVNFKDKDSLTALINAAENGSVPILSMLLDADAEVNAMSSAGFTALIIASAHGHKEAVQLLLERGAELEQEHPEGVTALMYAAAGGFHEVVRLLLEKGSDVNRKHKQGGSALMEAVTSGNLTVIELLLSKGADPLVVDNDGVTALMSAASQGHTEVCRILLEKGVDVNKIANSGGTAVMFAAGGGYSDATKLLISRGADVNVVVSATPEYIEQVAKAVAEGKEDVDQHKDGVTALSLAAHGGFLKVVQALVEAKAEVDVADEEGITPLLAAFKANHYEVATFLLEHGANANDIYTDDKNKVHSLLMDSIQLSNVELATLFVDKNANLTFVDDEGVTPLIQASYQGLLSVVEKLLEKGADITSANNEGINALIAAASEGHIEIVNTLLKHKHCDINARDKDGTNALMAAAVRGHKDVIRVLIDHKADINAQNSDGHTALMFAYNGKNQVETLLDKYSEYMKEINDNSTKIIKDAVQSHIDVVSILVQNGADVDLKDLEGHVATDFDYKPPEIIATEGKILPSDQEL